MNTRVLNFIISFAGAVAGMWFYHNVTLLMVGEATAENVQSVVETRELRVVDAAGQRRAQLVSLDNGGVALFFFDSKGRNRMNLGLYPKAEGELPFVNLNDANTQSAALLRLVGSDKPYLIFKADGQDKSIFGLSASKESFLSYTSQGKNKMAFGSN